MNKYVYICNHETFLDLSLMNVVKNRIESGSVLREKVKKVSRPHRPPKSIKVFGEIELLMHRIAALAE